MLKLTEIESIGAYLEYFRQVQWKKNVIYRGETNYRSAFHDLISYFSRNELGLSLIPEIESLIKELDKKYPEAQETDVDAVKNDGLSSKDKSRVYELSKKWRTVITSELNSKKYIEMTLKSGLNVDELHKLANGASCYFFRDDIWEKLSDIEKSDFSDSARCLLLGTATPSVMVALRGAEASVRYLYSEKTGNAPESRTWRQCTSELVSQAEELGLDERFVSYLDIFGDAKRNQAQHPNKIYNLREAVSIFMQVIGLVEEIYSLT